VLLLLQMSDMWSTAETAKLYRH